MSAQFTAWSAADRTLARGDALMTRQSTKPWPRIEPSVVGLGNRPGKFGTSASLARLPEREIQLFEPEMSSVTVFFMSFKGHRCNAQRGSARLRNLIPEPRRLYKLTFEF